MLRIFPLSCWERRNLGEEGWLWCCFLGKLLWLNFAILQTPGSLETQLLWPGSRTKVLGKGLVYTQGKETMRKCVSTLKKDYGKIASGAACGYCHPVAPDPVSLLTNKDVFLTAAPAVPGI